jgi:hypothetical protein
MRDEITLKERERENKNTLTHYMMMQAGKIIANLVILGSGVLLRAASQAYRQALVSKYDCFFLPWGI